MDHLLNAITGLDLVVAFVVLVVYLVGVPATDEPREPEVTWLGDAAPPNFERGAGQGGRGLVG